MPPKKRTTDEANETPEALSDWKQVRPKNLTRSDSQRNDIERLMPRLEELIQKKTKSPTKKFPQWVVHKFHTLQAHVADTDRKKLDVKETHNQMKSIAKTIGHLELFDDIKRKNTTHGKALQTNPSPSESSKDEFDKNQDPQDFELESKTDLDDNEDYDLESQETDISDMPDLDHSIGDDALSTDLLTPTQDDVSTDQLSSTRTSAPKDIDTATNEADSKENDDDKASDKTTPESQTLEKHQPFTFDNAQDDNLTSGGTIDEQIQRAEQILDKEVKEIQAIPKTTQQKATYEDDEMTQLASQAIQNQWEQTREEMDNEWNSRRKELEINWNEKRATMEQAYKDTLNDQTSIHVSIVAHETEQIRKEFIEMKNGIAASK
jgi:hypothetical protein